MGGRTVEYLCWQVEQILHTRSQRAHNRIASGDVKHLHLKHNLVHLPQDCKQVVVADGEGDLFGRAKEVLTDEGGEADCGGIDVGNGKKERRAEAQQCERAESSGVRAQKWPL